MRGGITSTKAERDGFGLRLTQAWEACGMTQQELAQLVGYGWPRQIYCIEKGISSPSIIMLARLSKALKVPADKLLEGIE